VVCATHHPRLLTIEICVGVVSFLWFVIQATRKWVLKSNHLANHRLDNNFLLLCCSVDRTAALLQHNHHGDQADVCCNKLWRRDQEGRPTTSSAVAPQSTEKSAMVKSKVRKACFDRSITIPNTTCNSIAKVALSTLVAAWTIGSGQVQRGG